MCWLDVVVNLKLIKTAGMFNNLLRRHCSSGLNRFSTILLKISYSDYAVVNKEFRIKALVEEDSNRIEKTDFKGNFIEKLFVNRFQEKVLEYPQIDTIEEVDILIKQGAVAQKLITGETNNENTLCEVDSMTAVSTLKRHELAGFKIPRLKNGFGYLNSEYTYMQETLSLDPSVSKTISEQEDFGIYLIDHFGSDLQKGQYLSKLVTGEKIACFANIENETSVSITPSSLKTSAILSSDEQSYIISGTKCWVYNAKCADLFILSAAVPMDGGNKSKFTLFLIDKNTPGLEIHEPIKTIGLKGLNICDVTFNNIVVPKTSVLGDVHGGEEIISKALSQGKLNGGGHYLAVMRKLISKVTQHCIYNEFFNKDKHEFDFIRIKVANMASRLYVVESMTYLLTGRLDSFNNSDVFLESLILKIYASEAIQFLLQQTLEILGPEFFSSDDDLVNLSRDAQFYVACDDSNDCLRLILASAGLRYTMKYYKERRFLKFLSDIIRDFKIFKIHKHRLNAAGDLQGYLHLMFRSESLMLEDCVTTVYKVAQFLIKEYKDQVFERPTELKHLADIVIDTYAICATLGRASRAYCISVKLQDVDRVCTEAEVRRAFYRVRELRNMFKRYNKVPKYFEVADSIMNCNKYSGLFPVLKNLTIR